MTKEEFIHLDEHTAKQKSESLWKDGVAQDWISFSRIRNKDGKITILSFYSDGPIIFIDRKGPVENQVISECYVCKDSSCLVEQISNRPIAVEAFRMFCGGVGLDLIKQHFSCNRKAMVASLTLSEATRHQLNTKNHHKYSKGKSKKKIATPLGI